MFVVEATQSAVACYDSPNQLIESKAAFFFFFKEYWVPKEISC